MPERFETGVTAPISLPESLWLVCYDISDPKRLKRVARTLTEHGERVQWSLFSCVLTAWQRGRLAEKLACLIDPAADSVRFYPVRGTAGVGRGALPCAAVPRYFIV